MQEELQQPKEKPRSSLSIEGQSNFKGSWTNVMCKRLRNPEIRKQVIDLLYEAEQRTNGKTVKKLVPDDFGVYRKYGKSYSIIEETYVSRTREQIEKDFDEDLDMVSEYTPTTFDMIDKDSGRISPRFDAEIPEGREIIPLNFTHPKTGEKFTKQFLNIVESHEKGHVLRRYGSVGSRKTGLSNSSALDEKFLEAFDLSAVEPPEISYENRKKYGNSKRMMSKLKEQIRESVVEYLKSADELAERMSQLKNYFGMEGNEKFTKEHIEFAKKYYVEDTGDGNSMTEFFQAITPEKEDAFIELINSAGI